MKYKEYTFDNDQILFKNSILGKETVLVNGKVVSEKRSILGTSHSFKLYANEYKLITSRDFDETLGMKITLIKNGEFIEQDIVKDKNILLIVLLFGIFLFWGMSKVIT